MVQFDLEGLKGKKFAVNCTTEGQLQHFIEWAYDFDLYASSIAYSWGDYGVDTCVSLSSELSCSYCNKDWFSNKGYKVISYEEAILKEETNENASVEEKEDKISLTVEQLKRFYLESYKEGYNARLVCVGLGKKSLYSLEDSEWALALVKALSK